MNEMKKLMNFWLMAALLCGLGLSVTSCKDDDDGLTAEQQAEKQQGEQLEKAAKFWNVVGQLVGTNNTPDDYASQTFEPTIGEPLSGNATVRQVATNDLEAAAQRFCNLAGLPEGTVTQETAAYTWSDPDVGTLTYTKSTDEKSLATVDVNIRQVPGLRQLVYLTPEQAGHNANYTTCYYRFGDVISRVRTDDGVREFWVCVRPSFEPEGKDKSHWISLSPLPSDKLMVYKASNGNTYKLPKLLGVNNEQMGNLAEMLFAMLNPEQWQDNITYNPYKSVFNKGVPMFHDFDKSKVKYNSKHFWARVATGWDNTQVDLTTGNRVNLWKAIFGNTHESMDRLYIQGKMPLNLICSSSSWNTWTSNSPTIYETVFTNGADKESNMHHKESKERTTQVVDKRNPDNNIQFDVTQLSTEDSPEIIYDDYFKDNGAIHYCIRHATGEDLAKLTRTKYNTKTAISGFDEVFCYNKYYYPPLGYDLNLAPEIISTDQGQHNLGEYDGLDSYYRAGDVYRDDEGNRWFVVSMSGQLDQFGEKSPYSELMTFDNIQVANDGSHASNLPNRDMAIRGSLFLWQFNTYTIDKKEDVIRSQPKYSYRIWESINDYAGVDLRQLHQVVASHNHNQRQNSWLYSVAYNDGTNQQRLLRVTSDNQRDDNMFTFSYWDHYVSSPDSVTRFYPPEAFSNIGIYLSDLADQRKIDAYALDTYAMQPLLNWTGGDGVSKRNCRNTTDERAKDVRNYLYNRPVWQAFENPRDMWNAPIIFFRMTTVYDRGSSDYSIITTDGRRLTRVNSIKRVDDDGWGRDVDDFKNFKGATALVYESMTSDLNTLDGKHFAIPNWRTIPNYGR